MSVVYTGIPTSSLSFRRADPLWLPHGMSGSSPLMTSCLPFVSSDCVTATPNVVCELSLHAPALPFNGPSSSSALELQKAPFSHTPTWHAHPHPHSPAKRCHSSGLGSMASSPGEPILTPRVTRRGSPSSLKAPDFHKSHTLVQGLFLFSVIVSCFNFLFFSYS